VRGCELHMGRGRLSYVNSAARSVSPTSRGRTARARRGPHLEQLREEVLERAFDVGPSPIDVFVLWAKGRSLAIIGSGGSPQWANKTEDRRPRFLRDDSISWRYEGLVMITVLISRPRRSPGAWIWCPVIGRYRPRLSGF
jgi:hypothetical protein